MRRLLIVAVFFVAAVGSSGCRIYSGGYGYYGYDYGWYGPAPVVQGPVIYRNPYYYRAGHHRGW